MPTPTPLREHETAALADPVGYSVARFAGHNPANTKRAKFPFTAAGLTHAQWTHDNSPRSILFVVGRNEVCVPYTQATGNGWKPAHG